MKLWAIVSAGLIPASAFAFRWFLLKTDVFVGYVWKWQGTNFYPSFDIRNLSRSKTYMLGNIAYTRSSGKEILIYDNKSLWGQELKPGTIIYLEAAPVARITSIGECPKVEVAIRLQNGREFKGQGPGQLYTGMRKIAFTLRQRIEKASLPLAS
jgi:hypothetical protein